MKNGDKVKYKGITWIILEMNYPKARHFSKISQAVRCTDIERRDFPSAGISWASSKKPVTFMIQVSILLNWTNDMDRLN